MQQTLTIFYTSDVHGCFEPLACCMAQMRKDGNTLVLDGGDMLQGSPAMTCLGRKPGGLAAPAQLLNAGGYDFVTLGNHDFDYGKAGIEAYLAALDARCLCANVSGVCGVEKTALVTLENGLCVGLTGVVTHFVTRFERPETLAGIAVSDAFDAAKAALAELRAQGADVTVCIYHGGYEEDLQTGVGLSASGENQGVRICRELDFDVLLAGHQHLAVPGARVGNTVTCQPPDKAAFFARVDVRKTPNGVQAAAQLLPAGNTPLPAAQTLLKPVLAETDRWLDAPVGHLDVPIPAQPPLDAALHGSLLANFFNQVQLDATGADLSVTSLSNEPCAVVQDVTVRDVVRAYAYANTLRTIRVTRRVIKAALERSMAYFARDPDGHICVSDAFLHPIPQHFNYDYLSGAVVTADLRRPVGGRVVSIVYRGEELPEDRELTLCLNSFRASGAGGYDCYRDCEALSELSDEVAPLILRYLERRGRVTVDKTAWLHILKD